MTKRIQISLVIRGIFGMGLIRIILIYSAFLICTDASPAQTNNQNDSGNVIQQAWVSRYTGPVVGEDEAHSIAVDNSGFVYVTGYAATVAGYPFNHDYATVKYNALTGDTIWTARYNGPGDAEDHAAVVKVDNDGNVYVMGISGADSIFPFELDYATIKYNSAGQVLWISRYNGPGNNTDYANAMAVDNSGNVYVTGASMGSGTGYDYATVKYNSSGTEEWVARYNGPVNGDDESFAVALDNSGNIYVTGFSTGAGTSQDYATIKYNASGDVEWIARYNGPGNDQDQANDIKIDGSGYVYVTGQSIGAGTGFDFATIKYDPLTGDTVWVARYNGTGFYYDYARAIAIDAFNDIYVTGYSTSTETGYDYTTIKYSTAGTEEWVARYSSPGNNFDLANAIATDGSGNVYITGQCYRSGYNFEYTTVKYNSDGTREWAMNYAGPGNDDEARAVAVDNDGNVYVTGYSTSTDSFYNFATIKYEPVPTPVELSSFIADVSDGDVMLNWTTATELNNKGFEIERQIVTLLPGGSGVSSGGDQGGKSWMDIGFRREWDYG
jgi:uncharacterized delta-60 repeat protein